MVDISLDPRVPLGTRTQGNRISNLGQEFGEEVVVPAGTFELAAV